MKVTELFWDEEQEAPAFLLEDGRKMVPRYSPEETIDGSECWTLEWIESKGPRDRTPANRDDSAEEK